MGPADSRRITRAPRYSGAGLNIVSISTMGLSPATVALSSTLVYGSDDRRRRSYNTATALTATVWALARSLATTGAIVVTFSSCGYLDVSVPHVRPRPYSRVSASPPTGFPIRTSPGRSVFAAHRRFSQLVTSFLASESHRHPPCALCNFSCLFRLNVKACLALRSISQFISISRFA